MLDFEFDDVHEPNESDKAPASQYSMDYVGHTRYCSVVTVGELSIWQQIQP